MGQLVILVQVLVVDNAPESKNLLHVAILSVSTQDSMKITTAHPPHGRWREKPEHCREGSHPLSWNHPKSAVRVDFQSEILKPRLGVSLVPVMWSASSPSGPRPSPNNDFTSRR